MPSTPPLPPPLVCQQYPSCQHLSQLRAGCTVGRCVVTKTSQGRPTGPRLTSSRAADDGAKPSDGGGRASYPASPPPGAQAQGRGGAPELPALGPALVYRP